MELGELSAPPIYHGRMTFAPKLELQDKADSLNEVSLPLRKARFGCLFLGRERGSGTDSCVKFHHGRLFNLACKSMLTCIISIYPVKYPWKLTEVGSALDT